MRKFLPLLCLGLMACASEPWHKPGASETEYLNDYHDCEREAEAEYDTGLINRFLRNRYIDECMQEKGWTEVS